MQLAGQLLGVEVQPSTVLVPREPRRAPTPAPPVDAEVAIDEPGGANGAGASIRIGAPFDGYDGLRATEVIARLPGCDAVTLGAIELDESTHRRRRTVLDGVARQTRRRG